MLSFKNKKVIVFDLDGTIVNLPVNWEHIKNLMTERFNEVYNEKCEFIHISACLDRIVEKNDERELQNFFKMLEEYELSSIQTNKGEIQIFEIIYFIKNVEKFGVPKNIKLAILSLNTRKAIKEALKLTTIEDRIDYIVGREDIRKWKPDPEGLLKIKEHFKVKKDEMIYFGDLDKDIMTGKNAKIKSYLIDDLIKVVNEKKEKTKN